MKASMGIMLVGWLLSVPAHAAPITKLDKGFDVTHADSKPGISTALDWSGNYLSVDGQLGASNLSVPSATQTTSPASVLPSAPRTNANPLMQDWVASTLIDETASTLLGGLSGWLASSDGVVLAIENVMAAFTQPGVQPQVALVEEKFASVRPAASSSVPEPNVWGSLSAGLFVLGVMVSRRKQNFYK